MQVSCCAGGSGGGGGGSFSPGPLLSGVGGNNNDTVAQGPTAGSLVYGNATPLWDELVVGTNGDVLTVAAGLPAWAARSTLGFANTALSNLAAVAINTTLASDTANTDDLGTAAIPWRTIYLMTSLRLLAAASDANARLLLSGATISFGAGGGTAVDASIARTSAATLTVTATVAIFTGDITNVANSTINIFANAVDAQPLVTLTGVQIGWGAGGGTAVDAIIIRLAANVLGVGAGDALRFQGATSDFVGIIAPATATSWTLTLPNAAAAVTGHALTSTTGGVASWGVLGVVGGGTGAATFTAFSVICAGTTATGAFQNVSGLGTSGFVLTSNGAGALPTWQANAAAGANTALSNLAAVAINTTLVSDTNNTDDLGTTTVAWKNLYLYKVIGGGHGQDVLVMSAAVNGDNVLMAKNSTSAGLYFGNNNALWAFKGASTGVALMAGALFSLDASTAASSSQGDSGFSKSAETGGNLLMQYDGTTIWTNSSITLWTWKDAFDFAFGSTTGTKFGTATTQKIGFYNATPIVQGASVADASGGAVVDAEARTAINALISRIEATGLIATV